MFRVTCCQICVAKFNGKAPRPFTANLLRWKSWSSSSRVATKPAEDLDHHREADSKPLDTRNADYPSTIDASSAINTENLKLQRISSQTLPIVDVSSSPKAVVQLPQYFPTTVAETILSVKNSYNKPLTLINATDPAVLEKAVKLDAKDLVKCYLGLSKSRLTGLVVVTAMAGYALAPASFAVGPFLSLSLGTALTSAAANTVNQIVEVPFDSQMDRTKNRVLVRQTLSKEHAAAFAVISGVTGLTLLTIGANGLTAALGGLNLLLYTCVYTPMKRQSIANTWVGSVVGGIPPLMGWAACTGEISHGALLLAGILYAWQFPHFNALSWNLRNDYNKAGYKMMAISHPELCRKTSLRYSLSLIAISSLAPVCNVTSWTFVIDSLPLNGYLAYLAYRFYQEGDSASSRKLFRFSLIHLPTLILLMMVSKKAYTDKSVECPVSTAINEATAALQSPPSPPVVFASSINNIDESASSNLKPESTNILCDRTVLSSVTDASIKSPPAA
ncbi:Protoheme IX farnesyltransferase, mitochondrial [Orchesella cincta]|uniref:Protoheme IX farnesyltransferase, mitochondrial n=1 Tax=Orchesella cincta TaxID=48709 RepID=A0A1D2NEW4_ORCCI|nr:Protoheme IX farnesyltransferase, mitochondrial [Orchesella cincta]